ncbi:Uncharacterised protein [Mycobacterium tuberculosis]|nr:Uncharacterised protein [Mycobacterium tuberculosis]COY99340.1 Uncharacterised protein [Mycobacterium tuberculosis]
MTAVALPCSASASRRSRRAEINANSAPTKNALAPISKSASNTADSTSISGPAPTRGRHGRPF